MSNDDPAQLASAVMRANKRVLTPWERENEVLARSAFVGLGKRPSVNGATNLVITNPEDIRTAIRWAKADWSVLRQLREILRTWKDEESTRLPKWRPAPEWGPAHEHLGALSFWWKYGEVPDNRYWSGTDRLFENLRGDLGRHEALAEIEGEDEKPLWRDKEDMYLQFSTAAVFRDDSQQGKIWVVHDESLKTWELALRNDVRGLAERLRQVPARVGVNVTKKWSEFPRGVIAPDFAMSAGIEMHGILEKPRDLERSASEGLLSYAVVTQNRAMLRELLFPAETPSSQHNELALNRRGGDKGRTPFLLARGAAYDPVCFDLLLQKVGVEVLTWDWDTESLLANLIYEGALSRVYHWISTGRPLPVFDDKIIDRFLGGGYFPLDWKGGEPAKKVRVAEKEAIRNILLAYREDPTKAIAMISGEQMAVFERIREESRKDMPNSAFKVPSPKISISSLLSSSSSSPSSALPSLPSVTTRTEDPSPPPSVIQWSVADANRAVMAKYDPSRFRNKPPSPPAMLLPSSSSSSGASAANSPLFSAVAPLPQTFSSSSSSPVTEPPRAVSQGKVTKAAKPPKPPKAPKPTPVQRHFDPRQVRPIAVAPSPMPPSVAPTPITYFLPGFSSPAAAPVATSNDSSREEAAFILSSLGTSATPSPPKADRLSPEGGGGSVVGDGDSGGTPTAGKTGGTDPEYPRPVYPKEKTALVDKVWRLAIDGDFLDLEHLLIHLAKHHPPAFVAEVVNASFPPSISFIGMTRHNQPYSIDLRDIPHLLFFAVRHGDTGVALIKTLARANPPGFDWNPRGLAWETTPLIECSEFSTSLTTLAAMLAVPQVDTTAANDQGKTLTWWLVEAGFPAKLKVLIASGRDLGLAAPKVAAILANPTPTAFGPQTEAIKLLKEFAGNQEGVRRRVRAEVRASHLFDWTASTHFGDVRNMSSGAQTATGAGLASTAVFFSDDFLRLKNPAHPIFDLPWAVQGARFMRVMLALPLELQMIVSHKVVGSAGEMYSGATMNESLGDLAAYHGLVEEGILPRDYDLMPQEEH